MFKIRMRGEKRLYGQRCENRANEGFSPRRSDTSNERQKKQVSTIFGVYSPRWRTTLTAVDRHVVLERLRRLLKLRVKHQKLSNSIAELTITVSSGQFPV